MGNSNNDPKDKDIWYKLNVILKPAGALITGLVIAIVSFYSAGYIEERQNVEMKTRLYTELISKREEAESLLRKDMFAKVIGSFLRPDSGSLDEKLLELELLLYNFHESLNLGPLFQYLQRQIEYDTARPEIKEDYRKRLRKVAEEIIKKQLAVLEVAGEKMSRKIDLELLNDESIEIELAMDSFKIEKYERHFKITATKTDSSLREIKIKLEIYTPEDTTGNNEMRVEFWVGPFDFPMIDNTRMSYDERCAISLETYEYPVADITLVFFPGSYASMKEKPYIHEILEKLISKEKP